MDNKLDYIAKNIKSLRVRSGLSQEDVANKLGIRRESYLGYEANPLKVKLKIYYELSKIFNCDLREFFLEHNVTKSD